MPAASLVSKAWAKYGVDFGTFLVIAKGALPAVICVAMYEATPVANFYTTLGYLNSIVAALSFSFLPRAKFFQMSILNAIGICIGAAFSLLLMYCATQARVHTTPPEEMAQLMQALSESASDPSQGSILSLPYNSSASAVCGIWLLFGIWISTSMRARRPQLIFPVVMFSIVINVSATYGTLLPTMEMCELFVREVLLSMLTGLGVSFGVGIFFIPITSRVSARKMIVGYITLLKQTIRAEQEQVKLLKSRRIYRVETSTASVQMRSNKRPSVEDTLQQLASTHRALEAEINCIAREVEFNRLSTDNFREIFSNLGAVAFQIRGLDTIADALKQNATIQEQRMNEGSGMAGGGDSEESHNSQLSVAIYRNANSLFTEVAGLVEESLNHFLITFQMGPSSLRKKQQHKGTADDTRDPCYFPGGGSFSTYLEQRLHNIHTQALENLQNIRLLSQRQHKGGSTEDIAHGLDGSSIEELYLLLHMQAMLQSTGKCALIFTQAADRIRGDEKAFKNALRYPTLPTLKHWMGSLLTTHTTDVYSMDRSAKSTFGDLYHGMRDPEREHPETWWELFVSGFEKIYRFLGSEDSQLGFRAACATMSIAIVAFLASSQVFFIKQRLIWATITVPVALTTSSGSATRGLFWRVVGTVAAMVLSIVNYYIVDGRTAGIIVFLFVFLCFDMYIMVKFPRYLIAGLLGLVTQVLIIGYELQVRKIGQQVAETSGQPVYPIYEIAPYRLLAVIGGCFAAFIWTIFPSAVTDAYRIRTKLGLSLDLLAQYYTCAQVVWDIDLRALAEPDSPAPNAWQREELVKMRTSVFSEILVLLEEVKQHLNDSFWDPRLGGKFPTKKYREITYQIQSIVSHLGLISTTANLLPDALIEDARPKSDTDWRNTLVQLLLSRRSDEVVCTFSMLASSLSDGKPLPPCSAPALYNTSPDVNQLLSLGHMAEPGFIVYAAPRVVSELWRNQLQSVIENVRYLVGEFRFSILDSTYPT